MEIRRINDIQYWADAGFLNYAGVDDKAGSIFTIMVYQMLTIREEMDYPVVELIIYTKISGLVRKVVCLTVSIKINVTLRLQAKWYSYSLNCVLCWLKQLISPKLNSLPVLPLADVRSFTFVLSRVLAK